MTHSILVTPKPGAKWADFGSGGHAPSWYASLRAGGLDGVIVDSYNATPDDLTHALAAGLAVMIFQGYDPAVWPDVGQAAVRAGQIIAFADQVAYPKGATLWLDFEDCTMDYVTAAAWINAWAAAVTAAGYFPGVYVGAPEPLTGLQLYSLLRGVLHYWESQSTVPMVARRGYQLRQEQSNVLWDQVLIDLDVVQMDDLGGLPHGMMAAPVEPPDPPAPSVETLETEVSRLHTIIARVQDAVKGVTS